jgi:hypothetical protein
MPIAEPSSATIGEQDISPTISAYTPSILRPSGSASEPAAIQREEARWIRPIELGEGMQTASESVSVLCFLPTDRCNYWNLNCRLQSTFALSVHPEGLGTNSSPGGCTLRTPSV